MRRAGILLVGVAILLALGGMAARGAGSDPALLIADAIVGFLFVTGGLVIGDRPRTRHSGVLMIAGGLAWLVGGLVPWATYLHRGPLAHLLLTYPFGRIGDRASLVVVALAYAHGMVVLVAHLEPVTIAFGAALIVATALGVARSREAACRQRRVAIVATIVLGVVVIGASLVRLAGWDLDAPLRWAYRGVLAGIAFALVIDARWGARRDAVVQLVIDLGSSGRAGNLRERVAQALGDPSLAIGYPSVTGPSTYIDEGGQPVATPTADTGRTTTPLLLHGGATGVVIHDEAISDDPALVASIAAVAGIAASNAGLQAETRARAAEVVASRRRLVHATANERRQLQARVQSRVEPHLSHVERILRTLPVRTARAADAIRDVRTELAAVRDEIRGFANGVYPVALTDGGLGAAIEELTASLPFSVTTRVDASRYAPAVESTAYFVCAEALANVAKHAGATRASIEIGRVGPSLVLTISDDGAGGADARRGSGLQGLIDRVESLDGHIEIRSAEGRGTMVLASLPVVGAT